MIILCYSIWIAMAFSTVPEYFNKYNTGAKALCCTISKALLASASWFYITTLSNPSQKAPTRIFPPSTTTFSHFIHFLLHEYQLMAQHGCSHLMDYHTYCCKPIYHGIFSIINTFWMINLRVEVQRCPAVLQHQMHSTDTVILYRHRVTMMALFPPNSNNDFQQQPALQSYPQRVNPQKLVHASCCHHFTYFVTLLIKQEILQGGCFL
jgi:hypothetical protein